MMYQIKAYRMYNN